jgi:hypothetical protein
MMEALCSSETAGLTRATRRNAPEDGIISYAVRVSVRDLVNSCTVLGDKWFV